MAVSNSCIESLGKNPIAAELGQLMVIFHFILKMVYCVYSLEHTKYLHVKENREDISIKPPYLAL